LHFAEQLALLALHTVEDTGDVVDVPLVLLHMRIIVLEKERVGLVQRGKWVLFYCVS
jgi:hypothetical protein